jgi:2-polyprenyl-3-methyl-5-hydroxy-6-metoxy-1,4-benzoquinol methylase
MNPMSGNGEYRLFHEFAHRYDLHTPPGHYRHDHALVIREALRAVPENCRLLDVGCGTGVFLEAAVAAGIDGHGIDASPEMVEVARCRVGNGRVRIQRMQEIGDENAYDVISIISCTIHYCETAAELDDVLRRCRNALRRNGLLLVQVVNDEQMTGAVKVDCEPGPSGEPDDTLFLHQFLPLRDAAHSAIASYVYASRAYSELVSERHELRFANAPLVIAALCRAGFQEVLVVNSNSISPFVVGKTD